MSTPITTIDDLQKALRKSKPQVILGFTHSASTADEIFSVLQQSFAGSEPVEEIKINGLEADTSAFHAEMSTIPMFFGLRILFVRHADNLLKKIDSDPTVRAYFERDLPNIPDTTFLLLQFDGDKIPAKVKFFENNALLFQEKKLKETNLPEYLFQKARQTGFQVSFEAMSLLAEKSAFDANQAVAGLNRLMLYNLREKKISEEDVQEICTSMEGDLIFSIVDNMAERKISKAVQRMQQQKIKDEKMVLGIWAKFFSELFRFRTYQSLGYSGEELHRLSGLKSTSSFFFQKNEQRMRTAMKMYSPEENRKVLYSLLKLDRRLKETSDSTLKRTLLLQFLTTLLKK